MSKKAKFFELNHKFFSSLDWRNHVNSIGFSPSIWQRLIIIGYVLLAVAVVYHFAFARKIIPGVKIGSVSVGGKSFEEAKAALAEYESTIDKKITLTFEDKNFEFKGDEVGLQYNWDASISRAYEVGRTGNVWIDTRDKIAGLVKPIYLAAFYDYDEDLFHSRFSQIKGEINQEEVDAHYVIPAPGQLDTVEAVEGRSVASDDLFKMIINDFDRIKFTQKQLPVKKMVPNITKRDIDPFYDQVKKIVYNPLKVVYGKKQMVLDSKKMLEFLAFSKKEEEATLTLNSPKYGAFLENIAQELNQPPRGRVAQTDGDRVVKFEITQAGKELDARTFTKEFRTAYISALPMVEAKLKDVDTPSNTEKYGIFALLGEGKSKFAGSSNARIHNLSLASQRTDGVLVAPGGVYSLNNAIGEISARTGYDTALIIQNGRTVLGEGGGVCQVSTTLFRAVLHAGLPVVMRYPHAYRVHYYEEDSPPGIDASIFQPTLDFQFKNDTPNYVLIQTFVDRDNLALNFKIYGTPDGRSVDMTEPVVTNQTPPPEPLLIDDPTLAKGVRIQSDWAAWGANVSFTRTVKRGGDVLHSETFSTRYQPWRAIYRVGTKE